MEPPRRNLVVIAALGILLIGIGVFSKSWFSGSDSTGSVKVGLTGGESCAGGQCQSIGLEQIDDNWNLVGIGGVIAGLAAMGVTGYAIFLLVRRREGKLDPKKLALPVGVGAAATVVFVFIGQMSKKDALNVSISWSGVVALLGYGAAAGAMFLSQRWLGSGVAQPGWGQPQPGWGQPPQQGWGQPSQGYAPPQGSQPPQGYAPPQQAQGYAPPQQPVQPIQPIRPTMPAQPMMPQAQPMMPQAMIPMQPGQPQPVAMMQKQSTTIAPGTNPCPRCSTGLAYSSQYGKWYCARCQQYV